jgi:hypothetical protein
MGSKKTKTKQSNRPIYSAQVEGAAQDQRAAYARQQPMINDFADNAASVSGDLFNRYREGDPVMTAAQGYITDTLGGDIQNNPYLDDMIAQTGDSLQRRIQTQLGTRGGIGGSSERKILANELAKAELGMRYQDYDSAMARRAQAAGMAPGITAGSMLPLDAALKTGSQGAMLPLQAALANSAGVGGLLGQYQNVQGEQKTSPGFMDFLGMGIQGAGLFSDRRLKTDVKRVGFTDGGVPVYTYRYGGKGPYHMGVMADEVPNARGADVDGFATVLYEEVA